MPKDCDCTAVLGNGLQGLDRQAERRVGSQAEVALLRKGGVHEDEREFPAAGLS